MHSYLDVKMTAEILDKSESQVRRLCGSGRLPGARKKAGQWEVPTTADDRLFDVELIWQSEQLKRSGVLPGKIWAATIKTNIVREAEWYAAKYENAGRGPQHEGFRCYASQRGIAWSKLYRWKMKFRMSGLAGLIDGRGRRLSPEEKVLIAEAYEEFKDKYLSFPRSGMGPAWIMISILSERKNLGWKIPRYEVMHRIVKERMGMDN